MNKQDNYLCLELTTNQASNILKDNPMKRSAINQNQHRMNEDESCIIQTKEKLSMAIRL